MARDTPKGYERYSTFNPQQQQMFERLSQLLGGGALESGQGYLQQLLSGDPEAARAFEAPYLRQFQEQTIPGLAERFAGMGAGAQSSSAFQQALGQAGAGLQENLAQMREGLKFQAAGKPFDQLMQLLGLETQGMVQKPKSGWQSFFESLSGGLGQGLGSAGLGGLGSFGNLFGKKQQGSYISPRGQITGPMY